jgi:hypothetical protein
MGLRFCSLSLCVMSSFAIFKSLHCVPGASDATYHVMWIFLFSALDEFGIKDINDLTRVGSSPSVLPDYEEIEMTKRNTFETALHAGLRIAGLVSSRK